MIAPSLREPPRSEDLAAATRRLAAVVHLASDRTIHSGNAVATALFPSLGQGETLDAVLEAAEKSGVLPAGTGARIVETIRKRRARCLFEMRDGRHFQLSADYGNIEDAILEFTDVTFAVHTTLSQQRDALTGLPNRLALLHRLEELTVAAAAPESRAALLYIDLDRFKLVNDTLGHPVGDALLKVVAERIGKLLAPGDLLVRLGGDEFAVVQAEGEQPHAAERLAAQLVELLGRTYLVRGNTLQIGASIGICLVATGGETADDLIKNADMALFKAKSKGRGTYHVYTDAMDEAIQARRMLEIDLRRALALREFSLVYQPQFEIEGRRLVGFEALVRWQTEERGPVSPAAFIPLAEEIGIIDQLGEWVLRTACNEAAGWREPLTVSVNLSPLQFKSRNLVPAIVSALANAGLEPSRLDLEITEGALMDGTDAVLSMLGQIKALGIRISMDDFGTGYSSLGYLQKFPFDKIKIDQSFIRSLDITPDSAAIVRAVIALGRSLDMVTIAEGVETESQLSRIAKDGCQQVQGYLTGKPMPADALAAFVDLHKHVPEG